jgi:SAM-dependent methyltransferase
VALPPAALEPASVLPEGVRLSAEAERLRSWFGLPISLLPVPRPGFRGELSGFVLDVNHLIAGRIERLLPWELLSTSFPPATLAAVVELFRVRYSPLWSREEGAGLRRQGAAGVEAEWRRRGQSDGWGPAFATLNAEADLPRIWSELGTGDFDSTGRGNDYTEGMHYFQAARAMGVETLLEHLGAFAGEGGVILDVLGGDGYILRIFEAIRKLRHLPLAIGECSPEALRLGVPAGVGKVAEGGGALILALADEEPDGAGARSGRFLAALPGGVEVSAPVTVPAEALATLRRLATLLPGGGLGDLLRQAGELFGGRPAAAGPRILTNDLSPHMFFSAGLWGLPTREDACRLSRTFRGGSLDGVIFAYGTHHVAGIDQAIAESFAVLRPGGRIVLQDFLDEGPVGSWFHQVVDPFSRTGHDFVHMGPIQLAVQLFLAGFRQVRMFEMEDPFLFAVPPGSGQEARAVACTYLLGMYGLGDSFLREHGELEAQIRQILSYAEIGNQPRFEDDFVYVPRRATGASAVRPESGEVPLSPADRALVEALSTVLALEATALAESFAAPPELLRTWFPQDGSRWGLTPREIDLWFERVSSWRRSS